jgi:hypothetical protein
MAVGYLQGNIASSNIFTVLAFYRMITVSTWHSCLALLLLQPGSRGPGDHALGLLESITSAVQHLDGSTDHLQHAALPLVQASGVYRIISTLTKLINAQVAGKRLFDFYIATAAAGSSDGGGKGSARLLTEDQGSSKDVATSALLARLEHATYSWHATTPCSEGPAAPPTDLAADSTKATVEGGMASVAAGSSTPSVGTGVLPLAAHEVCMPGDVPAHRCFTSPSIHVSPHCLQS